jgi:transposase
MRGHGESNGGLWYTLDLEELVERDHPLRAIKRMVDEALRGMDRDFRAAYPRNGRPSVAPERLLKALLLQSLYTIRSERELCRRLKTDMLFRWFLDMTPDEDVFVPTVFTHNRERLAEHGLTRRFFDGVVRQAIAADLASDEHFTVDGSLIQSHASLKSLKRITREDGGEDGGGDGDGDGDGPSPQGGPRRKGRNAPVDFKGERRVNDTHRSTTDPESRLYRKGGTGAYLSHSMHAMTENRHGLVVAVEVDEANGRSEREAALRMVTSVRRRHRLTVRTLGADAGYDAEGFLLALGSRRIVPHVALRRPGVDATDAGGRARAAVQSMQRQRGYRMSQRRRKVVEEFFGWAKTIAGLRRSRHVGRWKMKQQLELTAAAYNLVRLRRLLAA